MSLRLEQIRTLCRQTEKYHYLPSLDDTLILLKEIDARDQIIDDLQKDAGLLDQDAIPANKLRRDLTICKEALLNISLLDSPYLSAAAIRMVEFARVAIDAIYQKE